MQFDWNVDKLFWAKVPKNAAPDQCWLWHGTLNTNRYGYVNFGGGKHLYAHRVMFQLIHGALPPKIQVCHRCDNPQCVNPAHLFAGTNGDNVRDCVLKKRDLRRKKLTDDQVREMRQLRAQGWTLRTLGQHYGVTETQVSYIVRRLQWQQVA